MKPLWHWPALVAACGGTAADEGPDVTGISIDTRSLAPGDLFVALASDPGPRFNTGAISGRDGHEYLAAAAAAGAAAALVSEPDPDLDLPQIRVPDTLDGLWSLAAAARQRVRGQVVAITGSAGKTTTRQWLEAILARYGKTHASTGSLNNHWGLPLTLARMPADSEFGIVEIGINHPGEMAPLAQLAAPDVAVVLNVLPAHLGNYRDLDELREQKLMIASGLGPEGTLVVHDEIRDPVAPAVVRFGFSPDAGVRGELLGLETLSADVRGHHVSVSLGAPGEHRALTALACLAVVDVLGLSPDNALAELSVMELPRGRGNPVTIAGVTVIDDSYNANPVSMRYALEALARSSAGRKIAILGEMLELGADAAAMHHEVLAATRDIDEVITVGEGFAGASADVRHYAAPADIDVDALAATLQPDDSVLVKGSNRVFWAAGFVASLCAALERRNTSP